MSRGRGVLSSSLSGLSGLSGLMGREVRMSGGREVQSPVAGKWRAVGESSES